MKNIAQINSLDIEILSPDAAEQVDIGQWNQLAQQSRYPNPFFEPWNLLPALRNLTDNNEIYLITIKDDKGLAGLFPVSTLFKFKCIRYLSIWKHDHCFLGDPLLLSGININDIIDQLKTRLGANWFFIPLHSPQLLRKGKFFVYDKQCSRGGITDNRCIQSHLDGLSGKSCREIRRYFRKIHNNFNIKFIEHFNPGQGISHFTTLEHKGWKGKSGGSILAKKNIEIYYNEMAEMANSQDKFVFQELWADSALLAMSMRIKTRGFWFDIKTTYDEDYRQYSPGKVLELINLEFLKFEHFQQLDSCTSPENVLVNKYWPEKITLHNSNIFFTSLFGRFWKNVFLIKWFISSLVQAKNND
jgi:hypothetical protein